MQLREAIAQNNRLGSLTALDLSGNVMIGLDSRRCYYDQAWRAPKTPRTKLKPSSPCLSRARSGGTTPCGARRRHLGREGGQRLGAARGEWIEEQIPGPAGKSEPWAGKGAGGVRASGVRMGGRLGFGAYECAGQPPKGLLEVKKDDPRSRRPTSAAAGSRR